MSTSADDTSNLTYEQAIALAKTGWWKGLPAKDIVRFQLFESKLCMDFGDFQLAIEEALGRPVWTHEFADWKRLQQEFLGGIPPPSMEEILSMIPAEKRVVVVV